MPKKKKGKQGSTQSNDNQLSNRRVNVYRWQQWKKFTALEDAIIAILEQKGGLHSKEIADAFCLLEDDVDDIIKSINDEYEDTIQGDQTRHSLCDGFLHDLPDGIAIEKEKKDSPDYVRSDSLENAAFLDKMQKEGYSPKPDKFNDDFLKEHKAEVFSLEITFNPNDKNTVFQCNGINVPESFCEILREKLLPKKKK